MRKRIQAILLAAALLLPLAARGEFGTGGQMISPADLALVPEDRIVSRVRAACGNYSWSYAPKPYSEPDERIETSACGAAPTDPEMAAAAEILKLPGTLGFEMEWRNGWRPDTLTVSVWNTAVFDHPDRPDSEFLGTFTPEESRIELEPDRVYCFRGVWELEKSGNEYGEAEYYVVTGRMTEQETAEARARADAPFSEEDLRFLTVKIDGIECVLGTTTLRDLIRENKGLRWDQDDFGLIIMNSEAYADGEVYLYTENGSLDEPVTGMNAYWAYEIPVEYYGFDGKIGDVSTDPDNLWREGEYRLTEEELLEWADDDDFENSGLWDGMVAWMQKELHAASNSEGIWSATVTLSNGHELTVSTHESPVGLLLD